MCLVLGDWSDGGRTPKFSKSTKGTGWINTFATHGIPCYLIDEFRTSSLCPCCFGRVKCKLKTRESSRPWRRDAGAMESVHGLLGCNNQTRLKSATHEYRFFNRDALSTANMMTIINSILEGCGRPARFRR